VRPYHVRAALVLIPRCYWSCSSRAEDKKPPTIPVKDWKGATAFKVLRTIDDTIEGEQNGTPVNSSK
jgi:hypothetical protein